MCPPPMYFIYREPPPLSYRKPFLQHDNSDGKMVLRINWQWPRWWVWLITYLVIAFLTFGFTFNSWKASAPPLFEMCSDPAWRNIRPDPEKGTDNYQWCAIKESTQIGNAIVQGFLWPVILPFNIAIKLTGG